MLRRIPDSITREHILAAIAALDRGVAHEFGKSTGYDVLYKGRRYPPKAVVGLAVGELQGTPYGPYDFKGGLRSQCFRALHRNKFTIVTKGDTDPFPDEVGKDEKHSEGSVQTVTVNRYERDSKARANCIAHYGAHCQVCRFSFEEEFGAIGEGFIHVHHVVPLAEIGMEYEVDPVSDLRPVCPNCHAMLHKRIPPYSIEELQKVLKRRG